MSSIPAKHIDGDIGIGRHVSAGGNVKVQGHVSVGHNLKVEGWLDAPNIKGPSKGLFGSVEALESAYPQPEPGWWALVGTSLPAQVCMVCEGEWKLQKDENGSPLYSGNPTVDSQLYEAALSGLEQRLDDAETEIETNAEAGASALEELREDICILPFAGIFECREDISDHTHELVGPVVYVENSHMFLVYNGGEWIPSPVYNTLTERPEDGKIVFRPRVDCLYRCKNRLYTGYAAASTGAAGLRAMTDEAATDALTAALEALRARVEAREVLDFAGFDPDDAEPGEVHFDRGRGFFVGRDSEGEEVIPDGYNVENPGAV
ncbi:MAG: hypothetical protein K2M06_04505, partial [Muribaculaceae bacterium]|nr:hypothetical protein [Muribaculaceae bacterium]